MVSPQNVLWLFLLVTLAAVAATGCDHGTATVPVNGVVTLDEEPVEGASVTFSPVEGRPATGTTNASGEFALMTFEGGNGVSMGSYTVTVAKVEISGGPQRDLNSSQGMPADRMLPGGPGIAGPPKITWGTPREYSNPRKSGLAVEVSSDMELPVKLELTSQ